MIYLDHSATTSINPRVKEFIISLMDKELNPSSIHRSGVFARNVIEEARFQLAAALEASSREYNITFTSSGTESNNLIMKNFYDGDIFISAIEHLSIYNHIKHAPNIKVIKVDNQGLLDLEHLEELLSQSSTTKKLVSIMMANNESGVLQNIFEISKIAKKYNAKFHSDLVQAFSKIPTYIKDLGLDFATISGHKIGGGQGGAALISTSRFQLTPIIIGGGQEKSVRSGTENVIAIAGFGLAAELMKKNIIENYIKIKNLQEILEKKLKKYSNVNIISDNVARLPNTTLITIPNTDAQVKLIGFDLRNICVSSGSACSSGKISKSHVLTNMGMSEEEAKSSIRVSLSHTNTVSDIEAFIKAFEEVYDTVSKRINHMNPQLNSPILPIYMDYQATTPIDPRVIEAMLPYFTTKFGNPHSRSHSFGWEAENAVEEARSRIAKLIGADTKEIIFTSGATESNNLAIKGIAKFYGNKKNHIITIVSEHKCVLDACRHLEQEGIKITYLPIKPNGIIDLEALKNAITDQTMLVSSMAVNNEIGVIQPLKEIGKICRERGVFFHSDIAQGFGKIPIDVNEFNIDLASISGHKIYGPKGIGALYVRKKPRVRVTPLINGGGQERGMRSGTLPTPLIVGLGTAAEIAYNEMEKDTKHVNYLFDRFLNNIHSRISEVYLNGDKDQRYKGNLNLSFAGVEGESIILAIKDLAVSSGSACTSASLEPSYVLRSMGIGEELAHTSIRFGIGRFTTEQEIDYAVDLICSKIDKLRELSPLWEMMQEGIDLKKIKWAVH